MKTIAQEQFEKYDLNIIVLDGKGVDMYVTALCYKDGTEVTLEELEDMDYDLHQSLITYKCYGI